MEKRPFKPEDFYQFRLPGKIQVSPDGMHLVYVVQRFIEDKNKSLTDIYLWQAATKKEKRLTATGKDNKPRFSPDGRRLAFISKRTGKSQLFILNLDGGEAWRVPTEESVIDFEWFPCGTKILYTARIFSKADGWTPYKGAPAYDGDRLRKLAETKDEKGEKGEKPAAIKVITRFSYRFDGEGYFGDTRQHIFVTPLPSEHPWEDLKPKSHRLTAGDRDYVDPAISPNGRYILASCRRTEENTQRHDDIWLLAVEQEQNHLLYEGPGPAVQPRWSPAGRYISFVGDDRRCGDSSTSHLWLLPLGDALERIRQDGKLTPLTKKDAKNITETLDRPVGPYAGPDLRLRGGNTMCWYGDRLYFLLTDRGISGIYSTAPGGNLEKTEMGKGKVVTSIHGGGGVFAFTASTPTQPEEIFFYDGQRERRVTSLNCDLMENIDLGKWENIVYKSDDDQEIEGWLLFPPDFRAPKEYPLMLLIHGGPHGAYGPAFMFLGQLFATRGYVVLYTNPRGSESYGQEFACCIDRNWGDRDYADIMAGVTEVERRGLVDSKRLFAHGWSYGGYMSCWIVTQTSRFRAICAGASVTNLISDYGTSDITLADEWEYGGQPWRDAVHLMEHSPLGHVQKVATPLLLLHGENDLRCPASQTEEFYIALRRLDKDVVMVRYPIEYHSLQKPNHKVDLYHRLAAWFDYYCNKG